MQLSLFPEPPAVVVGERLHGRSYWREVRRVTADRIFYAAGHEERVTLLADCTPAMWALWLAVEGL